MIGEWYSSQLHRNDPGGAAERPPWKRWYPGGLQVGAGGEEKGGLNNEVILVFVAVKDMTAKCGSALCGGETEKCSFFWLLIPRALFSPTGPQYFPSLACLRGQQFLKEIMQEREMIYSTVG